MTKKKILALCAAAILAVMAVAGASLAYLVDTDTKENTFTVGNVDIRLIESSLHRENAGVANGATSDSELWSNVAKEGSGNTNEYKAGDTFYTDEQIEADAAEYDCSNIKLNPGKSYHKMPYVINEGTEAAYIRIRVMFPAALDTAILNSSMYTSTAMNSGEFTYAYDDSGTVMRDGVAYNVYTFTRVKPLEAGKMTYWNVWGTVHMDETVTNEQLKELVPGRKFSVLVEADGIQADGFADAAAAFKAFDEANK